ncbi:DUF2867 domain-containing protein [Streptomyces sp. SID13031]|uniref:DUF2867 domain-containing protein n=1 Tax=Streptomyces sp. SID13031 TaxID=2706046 RepID=UPI0013CA4FEC|nr:DUF2867 domain-containing protein [Streptomyces sp. SID13031]NEA34432.1 DUF2867 domain-containing protein [Streptomyces sp. SID13031]
MPTHTDLPELTDLLPTADVIDVKTATGPVTLREFAAGALSQDSTAGRFLFALRVPVAKLLRLQMAGMPPRTRLTPEDVSFTPGDHLSFFTVDRGEDEHYLLLKVTDNHLRGYLAIIVDDSGPVRAFKVVTLVFYLRPAGRFYYNLIRPFHHLVIHAMCRSALRTT